MAAVMGAGVMEAVVTGVAEIDLQPKDRSIG